MSDAVKNVLIKIGVQAGGSADPFKKIATEAANADTAVNRMTTRMNTALGGAGKAGDELLKRLDSIQKRVADIGSGKKLVESQVEDLFGISRADKQVGRITTQIKDRLAQLQAKATKLPIDADPTPLYRSLARIQMDVTKVGKAVEATGAAGMAGIGRAGSGALELSRGLAILGGEKDDIGKLIEKLLQFQAVIDVFRGTKEIITGTVGAIVNLSKTVGLFGTARGLSGEVAGVHQALARQMGQPATTGGAIATTGVVQGATEAAILKANQPAITESSANTAAIDRNTTALDRNTVSAEKAAPAGGGAAAAGGFFGGGGFRRGLGRSFLGGSVGYLAGNMLGSESPIRDTIIGAGALAAAPYAGKAIGAGAKVIGGGAAIAPTGIAAALVVVGAFFTDFAMKGKSATLTFWDNWYGEGAKAIGKAEKAATQGEGIRARIGALRGIEAPAEARQRDLAEQAAQIGRAAEAPAAIKARAAELKIQKYMDVAGIISGQQEATPHLYDTAAGKTHLAQQGERGRELAETGSQKQAEAERDALEAQQQALAAQKEQLRVAGELIEAKEKLAANPKDINASKKVEEMAEAAVTATEKRIASEQQVAEAIRQQGAVQRENQQAWKAWLAEQKNGLQALIDKEKDRLTSAKESFGLMDRGKQRQIVRVAQKLERGGRLTHSEIDIARGSDLLSDPLRKYGAAQADKNPQFEELVRASGARQKLQEAERAQAMVAKAEVEIKQQIEVALNETALVEQLSKQLLPKIHDLVEEVKQATDVAIGRLKDQQLAKDKNAGG